jgi:hypothetical protein
MYTEQLDAKMHYRMHGYDFKLKNMELAWKEYKRDQKKSVSYKGVF